MIISIIVGAATAAVVFSGCKVGERKYQTRKNEHDLAQKYIAQQQAQKQQPQQPATVAGAVDAINAIGAAAKAAAEAMAPQAAAAPAAPAADEGKAPIIEVPGEEIKDA